MSEDKTESGCGECDSCLAGYGSKYCATQQTDKTDEIPCVHHNNDDPFGYE